MPASLDEHAAAHFAVNAHGHEGRAPKAGRRRRATSPGSRSEPESGLGGSQRRTPVGSAGHILDQSGPVPDVAAASPLPGRDDDRSAMNLG